MGGDLNKLSDKRLKNLMGTTRDKPEFLADGAGLSVRVSPVGGISWTFTYRNSGVLQRMTLGRYPDMSLKRAREKRDECRTWLSDGKDPKRQLKLKKQESLKPVTVRDAIEYWVKHYATGRVSSINNTVQKLNKHIYPHIGDMALSDCETRDWLQCFDLMKDIQVTAGALFYGCKQALKFCRARKYAISNALDDLKVSDIGKTAGKRDRVLTDVEIGQLWKFINSNNALLPYYSEWMKILIVFGCRSGEARLSRWVEWDFDNWLWTVPKEHSKTETVIIRPIPKKMRSYMEYLRAKHLRTGYLLGEIKKLSTVASTAVKTSQRLGHDKHWTPHDLRRTLATRLNDMGVMPHVVEQLLGHAMPGVMGIYNRSQYLPEKLEALNRWMDRLDELAAKSVLPDGLIKK
ncbi:MAG: site-specific integrase [Candidatus Symbiopectobacterium sp. Dall1.0]|nr:site-specific integrase [Candidatus Symbiopectobacterium sp. Dall1.0]